MKGINEKPGRRGIFVLLVLLFSQVGPVRAEQLPIKSYTTAEGLARDAINCIMRDSRGFLWFGTFEGLSRFDGYRFVNYTTADGLPHRSVRDILETRNGDFWLATGYGVVRLNPRGSRSPVSDSIRNSKFQTRNSSEPLFTVYYPAEDEARVIRALIEDREGAIWCGTNVGVYKMEQSGEGIAFHFEELGMPSVTEDDRMVETLLEDRRGALWIGTRGSGLYRRWPGGHVDRYTSDGVPPGNVTKHSGPGDHINALLEDLNGRLWAGTTSGLWELVPDATSDRLVLARVYTTKDGLPSNWINALFQSSDGKLWVGTNSGLSEAVPSANQRLRFRSYSTTHGLRHNEISSLAEDRDGNLWLGSIWGGAMKLARGGFVTYRGESDGLAVPYTTVAIFETRAGELCLAERQLLRRFDGERFIATHFNLPRHITYFGWGWHQLTLQDRAGEWWVPTGQGLCRFPQVRLDGLAQAHPKAVYTTKQGLISNDIFRIFEDSRGDIWIGAWTSVKRSGVTRWERATDTFHTYTQSDGLPPPAWTPSAFGEDSSGNIWLAVGAGLARYSSGRFRVFTPADGLPTGSVNAVYRDHAGRLWIATDAGGVGRIDDPSADHLRFTTYTMTDGLSGNQISSALTEDQWGNIYLGTGRGVDRLNPETGEIRHYTTADGLAGSQPIFAFRDRKGALWFSTAQGLSRLIPEPDPPRLPPPVFINELHIAGELYPISELGDTDVPAVELTANNNQVQIGFVGLSFAAGEALRYQYKLEGADADWSVLTDEHSVTYASLSPGKYRFLVRSINADGALTESPATFAFTILPPIWQRWWFLALTVLLVGLAGYIIYRYRVAQLVELERVRTRIAADLHDDIGASLSRMAILSEVVKRQVAGSVLESAPLLSDIADSSRQLVGSMRDIVWAVDPRRDDLSNVVSRVRQFAFDVLEGANIKWDFHIPEESDKIWLGPDQRRHILLFFKEAINNVAKHSDCSTVHISIDLAHGQLIGEVRDDGRGFTAAESGTASGDGAGGQGLENMRRRVGQLGGVFSIESSPGQGTLLKLIIPLKKP